MGRLKSESVVFEGKVYRRYPYSARRTDQMYFRRLEDRKHTKLLHREIWKSAYGDIPPGHHIHHRDGNSLNNALENLECIDGRLHLSGHMSSPERVDALKVFLPLARDAAAKWHGSETGLRWHRQHSRDIWKHRSLLTKKCEQCGVDFQTKDRRYGRVFCGGKCRTAWRVKDGRDDEIRKCASCGNDFSSNRYALSRTCSRLCTLAFKKSPNWKPIKRSTTGLRGRPKKLAT